MIPEEEAVIQAAIDWRETESSDAQYRLGVLVDAVDSLYLARSTPPTLQQLLAAVYEVSPNQRAGNALARELDHQKRLRKRGDSILYPRWPELQNARDFATKLTLWDLLDVRGVGPKIIEDWRVALKSLDIEAEWKSGS